MLATSPKTLSVSQIADLTGVNRGTVGYWIRSKKLSAARAGKNYHVPVNDLLYFLKSNGKKIPKKLIVNEIDGPSFRPFQYCWDYWDQDCEKHSCDRCRVYRNRIDTCFTGTEGQCFSSAEKCAVCMYYQDMYYSRIAFIEQFDQPAAVVKDMFVWAVNEPTARLVGLDKKEFVGVGIERLIYAESLEMVIRYAKRRIRDPHGAPSQYDAFLKGTRNTKIKAHLRVIPLNQPQGAFLVTGDAPASNGYFEI